jgi:RimJ/RimL family protein N-acetyltransferase
MWELNVYWECWKNNIPSIKTALSCGFKKVADYPVLFVDFGGIETNKKTRD